MVRPAVLAHRLHKWLGLLVGVQFLAWLLSGLYMVAVNIDFIHGDPLVRNMQQTLPANLALQSGMADLRSLYPDATDIGLKPLLGGTVYTVNTSQGKLLLDTHSRQVISPLDEARAREIAQFHYNGEPPVRQVSLITADPPQEILKRPLPLWRIDFDDHLETSFYVDPYTGSLVTRRHRYWRLFDFLWMLHIMDYDERADIHHPLLWTAQTAGLALTISGAWLLFYRLKRQRRKRAEQAISS